jgi:hypothetical protein
MLKWQGLQGACNWEKVLQENLCGNFLEGVFALVIQYDLAY